VNNNLDIDFVKKLGVDVENLIMSKPNSNEALEIEMIIYFGGN
jgi:hypothetical protein